jgi:hypothetical protein
VFGIKNPTIEKAEPKQFGPPPADAHTATVAKIIERQGFTKAECREFKAVCENRDLDHITTFLCAWEDGCKSYDEFICFATTDKRPSNAKPRLEVAQ